MRRHQAVRTLVLAAFVMAAPVVASADIIDFTSRGQGATVGIGGAHYSGSVFAGELNWAWVDTPPDGFAQAFYTYCIDLTQHLTDPQTINIVSSDGFSGPGIVAGGVARAAWLFNTYAGDIRTGGTNTQAAALQVAIWEALYDSTHSLSNSGGGGGNFYMTTNTAVFNQANTYLAALYSSPNHSSTATVLAVSNGVGQSQITNRVSEPSTLLLTGVALLLFAHTVRRRWPMGVVPERTGI